MAVIFTVVDERLIWFLFPGRKVVSAAGSLLEGGKVLCSVKTRREAETAARSLDMFTEDPVIICEEVGPWKDLSTWPLVYEYLTEDCGFPKHKKIENAFNVERKDEEAAAFALRCVSEAAVLRKWPIQLFHQKKKAYALADKVASKDINGSFQEWFQLNDAAMAIAVLCRLIARVTDRLPIDEGWGEKTRRLAEKTINTSAENRRILAEQRFPERFQSLALVFVLLGLNK